MYKKTGWGFSITALFLALCIWAFARIEPMLGIDLRGGTELTYEIDLSQVEYDVGGSNVAEVVKELVYNRLDRYGLKEISIAVLGSDRLVIQLPGADEQFVHQIKRLIEDSGKLEFMLVLPTADRQGRAARLLDAVSRFNTAERQYAASVELNPQSPGVAPPEWPEELRKLQEEHDAYRIAHLEFERAVREGKPAEEPPAPEFKVLPRAERKQIEGTDVVRFVKQPGSWTVLRFGPGFRVSGKELSNANVIRVDGKPAIGFGFNPTGATQFGQLTGKNIDNELAIVLDDLLIQSPNIQSRISDRGQITGDFTYDECLGVVNILRGGSLPAKPTLISESTVGASLGSDAVRRGFLSIVSSLGAILLFMLVYYTIGGVVANVALILNIVFILGYVLVFRQTLTVPGIAGIILTIGMAVDANILIFERVREELGRGKSLVAAISAGYKRAFWVIFDSNLTTLITGVVLFQFGSGPIKGFAVTLIAGILASFFTAVFVTRLILSFLINANILKGFPMLRLIAVPRIDFYSYRRIFIWGALLVIGGTWGAFVLPRGQANYGIDFTGGTKLTLNTAGPIARSELVGLIASADEATRKIFGDFQIQTIDAVERGQARSFTILSPAHDDVGGAAGGVDGGGDSGARIQAALAALLTKLEKESGRALILPPPLPQVDATGAPIVNPRWVSAPASEGGASGPGVQGVEMEINVVYVDPSLTADRLRELLGQHLDRVFPPVTAPGASADAFKGIDIVELRQLSQQPLGKLEESDTAELVTRFLVKTSGYRQPEVNVASGAPAHAEVESAIKEFFKGASAALEEALPGRERTLVLSEPFSEVVNIGPRVAANLQQQAIVAMFIAMLGIVFYLSLRFEFVFGVAAIVALIHDVLVTVGIMALTDVIFGDVFSIKINLTEVAALLTVVGYSVNDTIIIFDRIRENLQLGRRKMTFEDIADLSVNQTLPRTIWTSLTTFIVIQSLLIFGGEPVKGFAFAVSIGLVAGTLSTVFIANPTLGFLRRKVQERQARIKAEAQAAA